MYAVFITRIYRADGWDASSSTPTFYLDEKVQMIVDIDHAKKIVEQMLSALGIEDLTGYYIQVSKI